MKTGANFSDRNKIIAHHRNGASPSEISQYLKIKEKVVRGCINGQEKAEAAGAADSGNDDRDLSDDGYADDSGFDDDESGGDDD